MENKSAIIGDLLNRKQDVINQLNQLNSNKEKLDCNSFLSEHDRLQRSIYSLDGHVEDISFLIRLIGS